MNKSKKKLSCIMHIYICNPGNVADVISTLPGCWGRIMMKNNRHRPSVSGHLRIPSIMSTKMVSDGVMDTSSCRLWQVIPDGNLSM